MDWCSPASSVCEISQTRILEWGAIYFSRRSSWTRDCISLISYIGSQILYHWATRTANYIYLYIILFIFDSDQFSSVAQSCLTLCDTMNHSTPGLPVHHQLPELTQTHVHWVGDAIQPSHPLSSPSPPPFNLSQHQGLFKWVSSSHQVAKVLEFQLQHQSFQWTLWTDFL